MRVKTTKESVAESYKIDRTPEDGVLLIVREVIEGKIFKALIDSGATRCFDFPPCVIVTRLNRK